MKNPFILIVPLALLFISCNNEKGSANTPYSRKQFTNECINTLKTNGGENYDANLSKKYCDCAADKVLPELSQSELIDLGIGENPELLKKVHKLVQPCLDEVTLQNK